MSDENKPELPTEEDKQAALELKHFCGDNVLKGEPYGSERCDNCQYYLDPDASVAYCWHPKIRLAVGGAWWCQWWEEILDEAALAADDLPPLEPKAIDEKKNEAFQILAGEVRLRGAPVDGQDCRNCHYFHMDPGNPDNEATLAYCWHKKLRIPAGHDWWCDRWEEIQEP